MALVVLGANLSGCILLDDESATAAIAEDHHCRKLGAVPQSELYVQCRTDAVYARDEVYDLNLKAEQDRIAAKQARAEAKRAARAAKAEARRLEKLQKAQAR